LALHPTSGGDDEKMISKRNEIRQIIKEAMQSNDLESLNKRFREEAKLQVVEKMKNDENRKKKEIKRQEKDKGKMIKLRVFLYDNLLLISFSTG